MKPELLLLDFDRHEISKYIGNQHLGMTAKMDDYPNLTAPAIEDMRTISFLDHRCPFRPPTSGTFA